MYETDTETESREHERAHGGFGFPPAYSPGRVSVLSAAAHYPLLVLLPVVLLVAAGAFLGLRRNPNYTASVRLQVSSINPHSPGAATGFADATEALASSYSRLIGADGVVVPVARRYHVKPGTVAGRVSATPIPNSPLFVVKATDKSARSALTLANSVADSLAAYVATVSKQNPSSSLLYQRYRAAAKSAQRAGMLRTTLRARYIADKSDANAAALQDATARSLSYDLRERTLASQYSSARQVEQASTPPQVVTRPRGAVSDRRGRLQLAIFFGLIGGVLIGLALATLRESRRVRGRLASNPG